jgi:hypothetical protein
MSASTGSGPPIPRVRSCRISCTPPNAFTAMDDDRKLHLEVRQHARLNKPNCTGMGRGCDGVSRNPSPVHAARIRGVS